MGLRTLGQESRTDTQARHEALAVPPLKWVTAVLPAQAKGPCSLEQPWCPSAAHAAAAGQDIGAWHSPSLAQPMQVRPGWATAAAWAQMPTGDTFLSHEWTSMCSCHQHRNGYDRCGTFPCKSRSPAGICPAPEVQRGTWGKAC